jgi:hypothetical protein
MYLIYAHPIVHSGSVLGGCQASNKRYDLLGQGGAIFSLLFFSKLAVALIQCPLSRLNDSKMQQSIECHQYDYRPSLLFVALLAKWLRRRTCNAKITRSNRVQGKRFASVLKSELFKSQDYARMF